MTPARPWIGPTEALLVRRAEARLGVAATERALGYAEALAALDGLAPELVHLAEGLQYAAVGPIEEVLGHAWTEHHERCHEHGLDAERPYHQASELERLAALLELDAPVLEATS